MKWELLGMSQIKAEFVLNSLDEEVKRKNVT